MSVSQHAWNVEKIATVLTAIIETTLSTLNSTKSTITRIEKLLKMSSPASIKGVHAENLVAQKNIANATKPDFFAEIYVSV